MPVNALYFEDGEEIFCQCVVIRISESRSYFFMTRRVILGLHKIPQQFIFHTKPLNLISLLGHNIFRCCIFLGRPFGRGRIPTSSFRSFLRTRVSNCFTAYLSRKP